MLCFQALWKTLRNPHDSIAHVAFRVLGKFGGGNRRMLKEPQKVGPGCSLAHKQFQIQELEVETAFYFNFLLKIILSSVVKCS